MVVNATQEIREKIRSALIDFSTKPLSTAARALFDVLGYNSQRDERVLRVTSTDDFRRWLEMSNQQVKLTEKDRNELSSSLENLHFLFQLTDTEINEARGNTQSELFDSKTSVDGAKYESYLFFAAEISDQLPRTRTTIARLVRLINKPLPMPALILFQHGQTLTLGVIRRRLNKVAQDRDVLEKVTVIKDISHQDPIRAHIDILRDLSFTALSGDFQVKDFAGLHQAWEKRLDSYALNEQFYRDVANWYFWALQRNDIGYPRNIKNAEQKSNFLIRLLTRLIFCWFLQEKGLIPRKLFRRHFVSNQLKKFSPASGAYYRAFLQNLFFATLNQETRERGFRKKYPGTRDGNRGVTNLYRYADLLKDPEAFAKLLQSVPFVNGGLFDCLDDVDVKPNIRLDDFSEERNNALCLPNDLFFGDDHEVDLSDIYGDSRHRREHVRGLLDILDRYKFTVEENTPLEQEIALDPELLGKVFENLLASYNEDTSTTARKATGSFYTRREIVSYMVDEALIAYLQPVLTSEKRTREEFTSRLRELFTTDVSHFQNHFDAQETDSLIAAIDRVKILDPACGSGAFPMGALHRLVDLLQKLDPNNSGWKRKQLAKAHAYREFLKQADAPEPEMAEVEDRIKDIERSFDTRFHALDFARKLYLIENCIYGVDIQPTACQIAKLRFFIALIVDQNVNDAEPNRGVRALPNLETKIVAADALVPIERPEEHQFSLIDVQIRALREKLESVRHDYFLARTPAKKAKCRMRDAELRNEIAEVLRQNGWPTKVAKAMAAWDPYDQNEHAKFFDPEWMFGIPVRKVRKGEQMSSTLLGHFTFVNEIEGQMELAPQPDEIESGFDIVIGNPPYIRLQTLKQKDPKMAAFLKDHYQSTEKGNYDLYVVFVERGMLLLKSTGNLAYILPHKFFNAQYGESLRKLIAKGKHLRHVVHFGDLQVFPGATNYVCLLFLEKAGGEACRWVRVDDLNAWLASYKAQSAEIGAKRVTSAEWNFAVGKDKGLFEKLQGMAMKLGDVADIFVGLQTSADKIYALKCTTESKTRSISGNRKRLQTVIDAKGNPWEIETDLLKPFLSHITIEKWEAPESQHQLLFPYRFVDGKAIIYSSKELAKSFPNAWAYLRCYEKDLRAREDGKADHDEWYGYIYRKNLTSFDADKLVVQVIAKSGQYAYDGAGIYFSGGGNGPYYGIRYRHEFNSLSLSFLQALLASKLLDWFLRRVSSPFRGGYWSYGKRFIEQLPIRTIDFTIPSERKQHDTIVKLVERILAAKKKDSNADTAEMEREIDRIVYELYDLPAEEIGIVEESEHRGVIK